MYNSLIQLIPLLRGIPPLTEGWTTKSWTGHWGDKREVPSARLASGLRTRAKVMWSGPSGRASFRVHPKPLIASFLGTASDAYLIEVAKDQSDG